MIERKLMFTPLVSGVMIFVGLGFLSGYFCPDASNDESVTAPHTRLAVKAVEPIPAGARLTRDRIQAYRIPADYFSGEYIELEQLDRYLGKHLLRGIEPGYFLSDDQFSIESDASNTVRATSIPSDTHDLAFALPIDLGRITNYASRDAGDRLSRGDKVDVLATLDTAHVDSDLDRSKVVARTDDSVVVTVAKKSSLLRLYKRAVSSGVDRRRGAMPRKNGVAVLEVTREEFKRLRKAGSLGNLRASFRDRETSRVRRLRQQLTPKLARRLHRAVARGLRQNTNPIEFAPDSFTSFVKRLNQIVRKRAGRRKNSGGNLRTVEPKTVGTLLRGRPETP